LTESTECLHKLNAEYSIEIGQYKERCSRLSEENTSLKEKFDSCY